MREIVHRAWRSLAAIAGILLAVLHLGILWRRVADGTLLAPLVVAQWAMAAGLLLVVVALRRRGVSVFRGRSGAAFWIVVALMHGIVALPGGPGFIGVLDTAPASAVAPAGLGLLAGSLALIAGLNGSAHRPILARLGFSPGAGDLALPAAAPSSIAARAPPA